jgi:hypothetical protein
MQAHPLKMKSINPKVHSFKDEPLLPFSPLSLKGLSIRPFSLRAEHFKKGIYALLSGLKANYFRSNLYVLIFSAREKFLTLYAPLQKQIRENVELDFFVIKHKVTRSIKWVSIFDAVLLVLVVAHTIAPLSLRERTSVNAIFSPLLLTEVSADQGQEMEPAMKELMNNLKNDGLDPRIGRSVERPSFSAPGMAITAGKDTFQVFNYTNSSLALEEASAFAKQYDPANGYIWQEQANVYVEDKTVIFYLGNKKEILDSLQEFAGQSLVAHNQVSLQEASAL